MKIELGTVYSNPYARAFNPQPIAEVDGGDHEVKMAEGQLDYIIQSANELKQKLGGIEKNIPGWIQDHISKAHSYLHQANSGYHELGETKKNMKLKEIKNTTFSSQNLITSLTPKVEKLVNDLKRKYPTANIDIVPNRYETDGSYTLSVSYKGDVPVIKKIESDIEKIQKHFNETININIMKKGNGVKLVEMLKLNENNKLIDYLSKSTDGTGPGESMIRLVLERNRTAKTAWYRLETDGWFRRYFNPGKGYGLMIRKFRISGKPKYSLGDAYYPVIITYLPTSFDSSDDDVAENYETVKGFLIIDKTVVGDFSVAGHVGIKDIERFVNSHTTHYKP